MNIKVIVKPNSKENQIVKLADFEYLANLVQRAEKGKANLLLIKILSKCFRVSNKNVLLKTKKGHKKIVEILTE
jgi:uncharacterized protein YggU (UPF0235/DUF167 family)